MKHVVEKLKLANGATLVNVIVKDLPITLVSAWFKAGSRFDQKGKEGTAHLLEHLLTKKTKKYSSEIERLRDIESNGIKFNAYTSLETAHSYYIQQKEETYHALDFLVDGVENYTFDEGDIKKEKEIVLNEMSENKLNPREYIWNLSNQAIWKNSNMGRNFFGDEKSIGSINKSDLEEFIQKRYAIENCSFVVVSDESTEKIAKYLNKKISLNGVQKTKSESEGEDFEESEKISVEKNNEEQVTIAVAFKSCSVNSDSVEVAVMDFVRDYLANKWISKLTEELRLKRNFTYWIDGETDNFSDTGLLRFIFVCNKKNVSEALKIISGEIEKIKEDSFDDNLDIHKKSFASSLAIKFTDPYEYLWWYGWQTTVSDGEQLLGIEKYAKLIQEIEPADMRRVASKYLVNENLSISAIGDVDEKSLDIEI